MDTVITMVVSTTESSGDTTSPHAAQLLRLRYIGLTEEMVFRSRGMVGSTRPFTPGVSCTTVAYSGMISFPLASTWNVEVCVTILREILSFVI